jgi:zinc knuckle protein
LISTKELLQTLTPVFQTSTILYRGDLVQETQICSTTNHESVRQRTDDWRSFEGNSDHPVPKMLEERYVQPTPSSWAQSLPQLRHYSYECKAVAQERPYVSRPSRTQQLLNPKLMPKLTSDVPQELLRKFVFLPSTIYQQPNFFFSEVDRISG